MSRALVLERNARIGDAFSCRLAELGFDCIDRASGEEDAICMVRFRLPDLVVAGDVTDAVSGTQAALDIQQACSVPVLLVTTDPARGVDRLAEGPIFDEPFYLSQLPLAAGPSAGVLQRLENASSEPEIRA